MRRIGLGLRLALQPLVETLRSVNPADRKAWLDEVRGDAPALADVLDRLEREVEHEERRRGEG